MTVMGHDENLPAGSQDIFMLDDSTLAWAQVNDPSNGAQIRATKPTWLLNDVSAMAGR